MKKTLLIISALLMAGCVTTPTPPRETHHIDCVLILDTQTNIQCKYNVYTGQSKQDVQGFAIPRNQSIYVSWYTTDDNGEPMPDFETLGHEVWHLIRGNFHEQ